ncbi:hypothetical protein AYI68_g1140 [Smittium mucronatum]|uniref:Uncharacterized protein n=1 Tax=Smittium mucronatum TaxID=133383 RepID=A0A1R0H6C4_9FUNG|nr:hypothetical protein AYI68_g1140 [Smittium mucronatum]
MGMVMRNHELFESGAYPYGFVPDIKAWREVAKDRGSDTSVSSSSEVFALGEGLDPSVNLAGEAVKDDLTSSLMDLSLSFDPNPPVRLSPIIPNDWGYRRSNGVIPALRSLLGEGDRCTSNSVLNVSSAFAAQQQFRNENLYQSSWYKESAFDNIKRSTLLLLHLNWMTDVLYY